MRPNPIWCLYKTGKFGLRHRHKWRKDDVKTHREETAVYLELYICKPWNAKDS